MNRRGAWDLEIENKLDALFGIEKFQKESVELSFDQKKSYFSQFINLFKKTKIVTIAGTNGKGETARNLHSHLVSQNIKTALWTSPHILSVRERFLYNEDLIEENVFEKGLEKIPNELSYYEGLFYLFCQWISSFDDVDVIILEVGLGGRLDATNFFDADLVCLTSISRDHCHILGNSLEEILSEKLGVCRKKIPLISALTSETLNKKVSDFTKSNHIPWVNLSESFPKMASMAYWDQNMVTSLQALSFLTHGVLSPVDIDIKKLPLPKNSPGRFEQMTLENRGFIFIGAHNLDGLRVLVQSIYSRLELGDDSKCLFSVSDRPHKEINSMFDVIFSCKRLSKITSVCFFDHNRALKREDLVSLLEDRLKSGKDSFKFVESWTQNISESNNKKTLILGSYYFISEVQKYLLGLGADFQSK